MASKPIGNPKQQRFAEEYLVGITPRKPTTIAEYEESNATKTGK